MDVPKRLKYLRDTHNMSQAQFAEIIKVSPGNVAAWELGKVLPGSKALINIAQKFDVSIDWLLLGKEHEEFSKSFSLFKDLTDSEKADLEKYAKFLIYNRSETEKSIVKERIPTYKRKVNELPNMFVNELIEENSNHLTLVGESAAGPPIMINETAEAFLPVNSKYDSNRNFLIRASGDSMIGAGIEDGDILIIRSQPEVEEGEPALVRLGDSSTIKYVYKNNGEIELRAANPNYSNIVVSHDQDFSVIGKVTHVIKKEVAESKLRHFNKD